MLPPAENPSRSDEGAARRRGDVRVGISGFRYPSWRGVFYPERLPQRRELEFASRALRSVELTGPFYSLQRASSYRSWYAEVPADFVFAIKGSRFITHHKKLRGCERALANFFASGLLALGDKLGPILWQLPPQLAFDADRLEAFLSRLPRTTTEAAALARRHDQRVEHGAVLEAAVERPLRYALEVRHASFVDPAFVRVLRANDVALCVAEAAGAWPYLEDVTAGFVYVRLHGSKHLYASGYSSAELDRWAGRIAAWRRGDEPADAARAAPEARAPRSRGRDVYVYFDNDAKVHAPFDAMNLAARLGQGERVAFPRARARAAEASRRAAEAARSPGPARPTRDRWRYGQRRSA